MIAALPKEVLMPTSADKKRDPVQRLWQLYRQGKSPSWLAVAAECDAQDTETLVALIRTDQRARWDRKGRPLLEEYLAEAVQVAQDEEALLDLAYGEICLR